MITESEFLAGRALAYTSFSGAPCSATFNRSPVPHLVICNASGRQVAAPTMAEHEARNFYNGIAAELGAKAAA